METMRSPMGSLMMVLLRCSHLSFDLFQLFFPLLLEDALIPGRL